MACTESLTLRAGTLYKEQEIFMWYGGSYSFLQAEPLMSPFIYLTQKLVPELADCDAMFDLWSYGVSNGSLRLFLINYH